MNHWSIGARRIGTGWVGMLRKVHKSSGEMVCENGKPVIYSSAEDAKMAAADALLAYLNADMRRCGETVSARSEAEKIFAGLKRQRGA